jgi:hypothetical protein
MERVAFLLEETSERLGCLLNPASLVMRRVAGISPRNSVGGHFTGNGLRDDPLLYTGGGKTILELHLLFDVSLAGSSIQSSDVRDLTAPLWNLAENAQSASGQRRPPLVRFVWGKSWNIPGIVVAVAERLEEFAADGVPQRSWLSMRLWRVDEEAKEQASSRSFAQALSPAELDLPPGSVPADRVQTHVVSGGERLDSVAAHYYTDQTTEQGPTRWRTLASFNNLQDPLNIPAGFVLQIPPQITRGGTL